MTFRCGYFFATTFLPPQTNNTISPNLKRLSNFYLSGLHPQVTHYTPPISAGNPLDAVCICGYPIRRGEALLLARLLRLYC